MRIYTFVSAALALVVALLSVSFAILGCGPNAGRNAINFGTNFANCGVGKIPQTAVNVQPVVSDALQHDPAWQGALTSLGVEVGEDVVTCAVAAAIATWQAGAHAALTPDVVRGITCGKQWLAAHGVAVELHATINPFSSTSGQRSAAACDPRSSCGPDDFILLSRSGATTAAEATGASPAAQAAP